MERVGEFIGTGRIAKHAVIERRRARLYTARLRKTTRTLFFSKEKEESDDDDNNNNNNKNNSNGVNNNSTNTKMKSDRLRPKLPERKKENSGTRGNRRRGNAGPLMNVVTGGSGENNKGNDNNDDEEEREDENDENASKAVVTFMLHKRLRVCRQKQMV